MFSSEVNVSGKYIKGKIQKQTDYPYRLYSDLNFINKMWSSNDLRNIADELYLVAEEIDKQISQKQIRATVYSEFEKWYLRSDDGICFEIGFAPMEFRDVVEDLEFNGWKYRWTNANGKDHYFYKYK